MFITAWPETQGPPGDLFNSLKDIDMPIIPGSLGVGSGLQLEPLLRNLETAERQPLKALEDRAAVLGNKFSAYGTLKGALESLQGAAQKLADPTLFESVIGKPSVDGILSASATDPSAAGNYSVNVSQLAQAQSLAAAGQASSTQAIGSGTISIDFGRITGGTLDSASGSYSGASFEPDAARQAKSISIDAGNNTLAGIRDAINAADAGVTANIVNDGSGTPYRLVLSSSSTGEASSMRISVEGDAALKDLLGHDPAGAQNLKQTVTAQDAKLDINGIAINSASNSVKDAIQGSTITLQQTGSTKLELALDQDKVSGAINDFVKAYNSLQESANSLSKVEGALNGDSTLRNIETRLRRVLGAPQSGGAKELKVLSEIGVTLDPKNGTLKLDSAKLERAIDTDLKGVAKLFTGGADAASASASSAGYGKQIDALVDDLTRSGGSLKLAQDGLKSTESRLKEQYSEVEARANATIERYRTQFHRLDVLMNSLNNTQNYLAQQFEAINAGKGK